MNKPVTICTREQFEAWIASTGCSIKIENFGGTVPSITIRAPERMVFRYRGTHLDASISCEDPTGKANWGHASLMAKRLLSEGFSRCENVACEVCDQSVASGNIVTKARSPKPSRTQRLFSVFVQIFK